MSETQVPELLIDVYDNRVRAGAFVSAAAALALQFCFPPTTERSLSTCRPHALQHHHQALCVL